MATTSQNPAANSPQRLGGFELLEQIGEGGMGIVYRARQTSLDRVVALKVLSTRLVSDPKYTDSFLREAKAAARLQHSNIVAVHDAGRADGHYYYAMEFVRGETLHKWLQRDGALPEETVLGVGICIANALKHGWDKEQLIHRDIKPDNIIIDTDGNVKVLDLGLAKSFGENTLLSLSGQVFGTPQYMSPEQARGDKGIDFRTDIYGLGMTLYHALTGQIPFHGGTAGVVMARQMHEQLEDPREHAPDASPHLCHVLEKMLAKNADDRYASWDDVLRDLNLARENSPPQIPLVFNGTSSMKRLGALRAEGIQNSGVRSQTPIPHVVGFERKKSHAPLQIAAGITLLLATAVIAFFFLRPSQDHHTSPTANSKTPPPTVIDRNVEAQRLLATVRTLPPSTGVQPPTVGGTSTPSTTVIAPTPPEDKVKQEEESKRAEQRMREESERAKMLTAFSDFQKSFLALLAKRDYTAAEKLATQAAANPAFASLKERAIAFGEVAKRLNNFHASLPDTLALLKGKDISAQDQTGVLVEVKSGVLELERRIGDAGAVGFSVPIAKLSIEEIASLTAAAKPSAVAATGVDIAWLLFAERKSGEASARLDAAQKTGANVASTRQTMEWLSNDVMEEEAQKLLAEIRQLAAYKKWNDLPPKIKFLRDHYPRTRTVESAAGELSGIENYVVFNESIKEMPIGSVIRSFEGEKEQIWYLASGPDSRLVASGSRNGTIQIWDVASGKGMRTFKHPGLLAVTFSSDGNFLLSGGSDGTIRQWDWRTGKAVTNLKAESCAAITISRDGKFALLIHEKSSPNMTLWEIGSGKKLQEFRSSGVIFPIVAMAFSGDGKIAFTVTREVTSLSIWELETGKQTTVFLGGARIAGAAFAPNGKQVITLDASNLIPKLFEVSSGKEVRKFSPPCEKLAVSADGLYALAKTRGNSFRIWELATGQEVLSFGAGRSDQGELIGSMTFSADGRFALTGNFDGVTKVWKLWK